MQQALAEKRLRRQSCNPDGVYNSKVKLVEAEGWEATDHSL